MAPPVGSLVVRIGSDIRGLTRGFKKGGKLVGQFGAIAGRAAKRVALLSTVTAAAGAALAVKFTRDGLKAIDSMAKFARVVGVSTEALAGLQLAAEETAGFTGQQFNLALQRMTRRIAEAAQGSGEAKAAIKELGLSARDLASAGPDEAFLLIADAMQGVTKQSDRLRLGFKLFDSEGARLVNTLAGGRAEIERFGKVAEELGLTFSEFDARQVEAANDAIGRIGAVLAGVSRQLAIQLSPFIQEFAGRLSAAAREAGGFGDSMRQGIGAGIELSIVLARSFRLAAIAAISTAVAVETIAAQTQKGSKPLTRFLARLQAVGDAAKTIELDKQFVAMDKAAAGVGTTATDLQQTLLDVVDSEEGIGEIADALRRIQDGFVGATGAAQAWRIANATVGPFDPRPGSEGADPEVKALREKLAKRLEMIRESLLSESQAEQEAFVDKLARLQEGRSLELLSEEEFQAQREALEKQHQERLTGIQEQEAAARATAEADMWRNRIASTSGFLSQQLSILAGAAGDNFKLQKALSIASAVLSGIESVVHSYNFGARIGGPILGAAFAGIAGAVQFARIAQISSQSFNRGSGGAPAVAAGPSGGAPAPPGGGGGGGGGAGAQSVNISLVGERFGRTQVRDLIEEINDAVADGARLRVV